MKFMKAIKLAIVSVTTLVVAGASTGAAFAIPYNGDNTVGLDYPAFNVFTGTPSEGNESDFFRGKEKSNSAPSTNTVNSVCANGTVYRLRVYVHNGAKDTLNSGAGTGIARGSTVKVNLFPNGAPDTATSFSPVATIDATNATDVSDSMTINCGNKKVKLSYAGNATQFTGRTGSQPISDTIVTTGASIGSYDPASGNVMGCWDDRVWVTFDVKVEDVPTTIDVCPNIPGDQATVPSGLVKDENGNCVEQVISTGECKAAEVTVINADRREIRVSVSGTVNNATIIGYKIDFGDGTTSDKQTDTHTYAQDGTYNIKTSVTIRYADGRTEVKTTGACTSTVKFTTNEEPVVTPGTNVNVNRTTPTVLPSTGAAGLAGIFAGVSTIATVAYSVVTRRFGRSA